MRRATTLLVAVFCMIVVQNTMAAGPETITGEDVNFTKFKLDIIPVDYSDSFPGLPKVGGGKRLKSATARSSSGLLSSAHMRPSGAMTLSASSFAAASASR